MGSSFAFRHKRNTLSNPSVDLCGKLFIRDIVLPAPEENHINGFLGEVYDFLTPYICDKPEDRIGNWYEGGEGPYELKENVLVEDGDIVFDCGANMGIFSALASVRGCERVYAFEPSADVIESYLSKTVEYNKNIEVCNLGVGDKNSSAYLDFNPEHITCGKVENTTNACEDEAEPITLVTLDSFAEQNSLTHVDFIKADIEGYERYMLMGATRILKEFAPKLAICTYHFPDDPEVLEKLIKDANPNYVVTHKYKKLYAYVPKK